MQSFEKGIYGPYLALAVIYIAGEPAFKNFLCKEWVTSL